jgi:hypothetical protein
MNRTTAEVMTEAVVHVDPASPLTRVLQLMVGLKTRSFPVMSADGQLEGKNRHWNSVVECPLCAKSGHMQCSKLPILNGA